MCGWAAVVPMALSAVSGLSQASQQRQEGRMQQQIGNYNAQVSEQQAADAQRRGIFEAGERRALTRQQIGRQRTGLAASGVDVSTGSALDIFADTAAFGEMDAQTIQANAMREAYGYRTQATGQRFQGDMARQAGRNRARSTLLTTGARTFNLWDQVR